MYYQIIMITWCFARHTTTLSEKWNSVCHIWWSGGWRMGDLCVGFVKVGSVKELERGQGWIEVNGGEWGLGQREIMSARKGGTDKGWWGKGRMRARTRNRGRQGTERQMGKKEGRWRYEAREEGRRGMEEWRSGENGRWKTGGDRSGKRISDE